MSERHPALMTEAEIREATGFGNIHVGYVEREDIEVADAAARKVVRYLEDVMEDHTARGYYELLAKDWQALKIALGVK